MTPLQDAFNQGVAAATAQIRIAAAVVPKGYGMPADQLTRMADAIDWLMIIDPSPPASSAFAETDA